MSVANQCNVNFLVLRLVSNNVQWSAMFFGDRNDQLLLITCTGLL